MSFQYLSLENNFFILLKFKKVGIGNVWGNFKIFFVIIIRFASKMIIKFAIKMIVKFAIGIIIKLVIHTLKRSKLQNIWKAKL
ncbi:MAG TPA: hypothetical protein EYH39_01105 [Desulfurobacteriaceae bacterium]|nr:hypothetical protein [Desulfurobacteriaceae bacterium]